jgi:hypothetical protein
MDVSKDILALLTQLMPGFLTAWVVYGLTTYTKPSQFERIVQALIYSFMVSALVAVAEPLLLLAGQFVRLGTWDSSAELIASAVLALALGFLLSFFMKNDVFFRQARRLGLTSRTPFPSEWYGAFAARPPRYVVLHLEGGRRITGYPIEWPTEPTSGHFKLTDAAWLDDLNNEIPLDTNDSILIAAKQVEMVEFLKNMSERTSATETA